MSRGGGRGGGGRGSISMNREQLTALGVTGNDLPGPITQPPPLFPILGKKPAPFTASIEQDYILILKQDFIDHMQLSGSYLKLPPAAADRTRIEEPTLEIDKLVAQLPTVKEKYNWSLFPAELRPKVLARKAKQAAKQPPPVNVVDKLDQLEKIEESEGIGDEKTMKTEDEEKNVEAPDEEELEIEEDEEMDDGVDYTNNYFDNGEAYEDEDDNLDDGPIY